MSYGLSFDLGRSHTDDRCRINLAFERCNWQSFGGSSLLYPAVGPIGAEDFFNEVLPPLWYFRSLIAAKAIDLKSYLFQADSQTGFRKDASIGQPIVPIPELGFHASTKARSTQNKLSESTYRRVLHASELLLH